MSECVKVAVRCRPMSESEKAEGQIPVVKVDSSRNEIYLNNPKKGEEKQFTFDYTYCHNSLQKDVYEQCAYSLIESVIEGYNATIFAYGQTGTGKTFTMEGDKDREELKGIIPRVFDHIFTTIDGTSTTQFLVTCSMIELYNEDVFDLLAAKTSDKLDVKEKPGEGFFVKDLSTHDTKTAKECMSLLESGSRSRKKGETQMNKDSSRSHSIFSISIETSVALENGKQMLKRGKLNLVDLAGSERQAKTKATGQALEEAKKINLSLVCLGKVISGLVQGGKHIPYRDSKLTKLLTDSLGGNTKTLMITNVGPALKNYEETLNSIRYANQAKSIKNKPRINEDPKDAKLREIQEEITKLKEYLKSITNGKEGLNFNDIFKGEITENMKSQMMKQMMDEKQKLEERHREEMEKIIQMRQISEEERARLLDQVRKHEEEENREREEKQRLLEKISSIKGKIIQGQKTKEEYLRVQKELQKKREENERMKKQQFSLKQEAEDADIEKGLLEKKYASQKEELKEKEDLITKISRRYHQLKGEYEEYIESYNNQIKSLTEENNELQSQIELNNLTVTSYFGAEMMAKLNDCLVYNAYTDSFKINEKAPKDMMMLFEEFMGMKEIQEKMYSPDDVDEHEEALFLYGTTTPY